jgi:hypothetical protein
MLSLTAGNCSSNNSWEYEFMDATQSPSFANLLLPGLISGVVVAVVGYFLTRGKTKAETKKLEVESEKIRLESEKIRKELSSNVESIASASYQLAASSERIIYDSKGRDVGFDFKGIEGYVWKNIDGKDVRVTPQGKGTLSFESGILNLKRTNVDGRYEIWLHTYIFNSSERDDIPQDELIGVQRRIRLSCEVKVIGGGHTLKFVFKGKETGKWLAQGERRITEEKWVSLTMYFLVSPKEECRLRIDDFEVSLVPSSLQIRNLVLAEKVS